MTRRGAPRPDSRDPRAGQLPEPGRRGSLSQDEVTNPRHRWVPPEPEYVEDPAGFTPPPDPPFPPRPRPRTREAEVLPPPRPRAREPEAMAPPPRPARAREGEGAPAQRFMHASTAASSFPFMPQLATRIARLPNYEAGAGAGHLATQFSQLAGQPEPPPAPAGRGGKLVVFFSCHGGSGSSTMAINAAAMAASTGEPACIVDLDLQLGDVATLLSIETRCPMSRVAADLEAVDWSMLAPMLDRHGSGLSVLSQVGNIEALGELDPGRVPTLLRNLQAHFAFLVVDGVRDFGDHALGALDVADLIVLVASQNVSAIRGAGHRLRILRQLGFPNERFRLVINRFDRKNPITLAHIEDALRIPVMTTIPNDFPAVHGATTAGVTLAEKHPQHPVTIAVAKCAQQLFDISPGAEKEKKKGFWSRLRGKGQ